MPNTILTLPEQLARLGKHWGWILATGTAYMILGVFALSWPVGSTLGLTFALGILFVLGGALQLFHSIQLRKHVGNGWRVFQSITSLIAGLLMLRFPEAGMLGIAIALTFYFFANAAIKYVLAAGMRPNRGWGWVALSAFCSLLLGTYIIVTFPVSALWVPGLLLGVDFVILGLSLIGFSLDLRRVHRAISPDISADIRRRDESRRAG